MKKIILFLTLLCSVAVADRFSFNYNYAASFRVSAHLKPQVIITTASWCGPCREYKPVVKEVGKLFPDIDFVINTDYSLIESPGAIPWTYIVTANPKCSRSTLGSIPEVDLFVMLRDVIRCNGSYEYIR